VVKKLVVLTVLAALAAAGVAVYLYWNGDEAAVKRAATTLAELASRDEADGNIAEVIKNQRITEMLADEVTLNNIHRYADGTYTASALAANMLRVHAAARWFKVSLDDLTVERIDNATAILTCEAEVRAVFKDGVSDEVDRDLRLEFVRDNGDWKLKSVTADKILK